MSYEIQVSVSICISLGVHDVKRFEELLIFILYTNMCQNRCKSGTIKYTDVCVIVSWLRRKETSHGDLSSMTSPIFN